MKKTVFFLIFFPLASVFCSNPSKKLKKSFVQYQYRFLQQKLSQPPQSSRLKIMGRRIASGSVGVVAGFITMVTINYLLALKQTEKVEKLSLKQVFLNNLREMVQGEMDYSNAHEGGIRQGAAAHQFRMHAQADISFPKLFAKTAYDTFMNKKPARKSESELWWITVRNMLVFLSATVVSYYLVRKYWFYETPFRDMLTQFVAQWPDYRVFTPLPFHEQFDVWHEQLHEKGRLALSEHEAEQSMIEIDTQILEQMDA